MEIVRKIKAQSSERDRRFVSSVYCFETNFNS